jgi:hypothetical protein
MRTEPGTWAAVTSDLPVRTCAYNFGPGYASALAVPCDGGVAIVSPPCHATEATFADASSLGKVRAIIAPNGFHTMGVAPWKARFPDAPVFAPAQSIARVEKKAGVSGIRPIAEAASLTGPSLELVDMPHYKMGEALVRVKHGAHVLWFMTDLIMNMPELPKAFPFKQLFKWTNSAPGLRPNGIASRFMVKDRPALFRWLRAEVEKAPPTILVACHGDPVIGGAGQRLLEALPS